MSRLIHLLLAVTVVLLPGCDFATGKVSLVDPRLAPMLQAIAAADRTALGFTAIPTNAVVHLGSRSGARYDALLLIYDTPALQDGVHRIIEFRKTATGYKWMREQEIHPGRRTFVQSGHTAHEQIVISYDTEVMLGVAPGKLAVRYNGPDSRMHNRHDLTLDEVRPILAEWSQKR